MKRCVKYRPYYVFRNLCYWPFLNSILQYSLQIVANNVDVFSKGYKILYNIYWVGFICNNGKLQRIASFAKRRFCAEIFLIFSSFSKKYLSLSFPFCRLFSCIYVAFCDCKFLSFCQFLRGGRIINGGRILFQKVPWSSMLSPVFHKTFLRISCAKCLIG